MEPERPIEKLLRASARKRRDEAGAPFELHPATRRWLQGEVTRRFGRAQRAPGRLDRWFWPKLAWGLGAVTVLAMTLALLAPSLRHRRAETLLAENKETLESALARRPATPAPEAPAPAEAALPSAKSKIDNLSNKPSPAAVPPASAPASPGVAPAIPPLAITNHLFFKGQFAQTAGTGVGSRVVQFAQIRSESETQAARRHQAVPTATVLVSFQFEQTGQDVRIVDKDGSVYTGSLLAADFVGRPAPTDVSRPATGGIQSLAQPELAPAKAPAASNLQQTAPEYCFFRVAGTNRTLKQKVAFSGKLVDVTTASGAVGLTNATSGSANRLGAASPAPAQAGPAPPRPSQIVGKAVIGRSQEIQINAVPVP